MCNTWCEGIKSWESKKTYWEYFWSNQWIEKIAEVMKKIDNNPNLTYDEKRKALEDYEKALYSVN